MSRSVPARASGTAALVRTLWETRYRCVGGAFPERTIEDSQRRVSRAVAAAETAETPFWAEAFANLLRDFRFLPGGRIQAAAGTAHQATLFNCFVMGPITDANAPAALREAEMTLAFGGGIGCDFSALAPHGVRTSTTAAPGPLGWLKAWEAMCARSQSIGFRRGAMIATLRCDHPDIEAFIRAKQDSAGFQHVNLSVLVTDAFVKAARADASWALRLLPTGTEPGSSRVVRRLAARDLWRSIMQCAYHSAEPGVLFIDRITAENNLAYCERIAATNPCGEIPLPAYGACDLGSLNLTRFVSRPFAPGAAIDFDGLSRAARLAVRFLDDVIDISRFPLPQQEAAAKASRRVGLGITRLADALVMLGLRYGQPRSLALAGHLMEVIRDAAYGASIALAREKGCFPAFRREPYLAAPFIQRLPGALRDEIARHGVRNSHLLAIAPAGSISLLAGNVSSGLEPIYAPTWRRTMTTPRGPEVFDLTDAAVAAWRERSGGDGLPPAFVSAQDLSIEEHLGMQAVLQPFIDNAISKTVTVAEDCPFEIFARTYQQAYDLGLKGCTLYRPNAAMGAVLQAGPRARCDAPSSVLTAQVSTDAERPSPPRPSGGDRRLRPHLGEPRPGISEASTGGSDGAAG
ncbi:adenosylcobalamin-dependent ribonucleoside-diphosphate reductase [Caulobacter sp. CCUG 60055]|uniref:adenosylcobalamin-dependent ribonucleoside-diphosphate reductase n=3 Tax=Pseudomonadota TaxID=1224 RepID=UPI0024186D5D|nr:adenosylcobalamin-dependent ribonucleoside-diphosphate reductase [Caulobacter sp. CCUG 60055]MCI3179237.1 adenosylcobalamin-dependent ribonucleoside-diphosphate reductase [Caulobacter sp. CCUG 60055]